jgi:C-terminal processing protease CtpA/Prc
MRLNRLNFLSKKVIPSGFRISPDNMIEKYDDMLYLRLKFQESTSVPFIYSHIQDFHNCNGLIIDLRGMSSGDYSVCTLFSFLISKMSPIINSPTNRFNIRSTVIVKPSNQFRIQCPLIILVDARTTCISELFVNALRKNRQNGCVIGVSNTAGSAQFNLTTFLPENAKLNHFQGITRDVYGYVIDDNEGIIPDIITYFDSYKDLFPYNDKLKCYALEYLKHINRESNNR